MVEHSHGRQHRLLGGVQGLNSLTDDPLDTSCQLARQLDERLLKARDLERIIAIGLVSRLVFCQPRCPIQIEALTSNQLRQGCELAVAFLPVAALAELIFAFERADVDVTQVGFRTPRTGGTVILGEGIVDQAVGRGRGELFQKEHFLERGAGGSRLSGAGFEILDDEGLLIAVIELENDAGSAQAEIVNNANAGQDLGNGIDLDGLVGAFERNAQARSSETSIL